MTQLLSVIESHQVIRDYDDNNHLIEFAMAGWVVTHAWKNISTSARTLTLILISSSWFTIASSAPLISSIAFLHWSWSTAPEWGKQMSVLKHSRQEHNKSTPDVLQKHLLILNPGHVHLAISCQQRHLQAWGVPFSNLTFLRLSRRVVILRSTG